MINAALQCVRFYPALNWILFLIYAVNMKVTERELILNHFH